MIGQPFRGLCLLALLLTPTLAHADDLRDDARQALKKAATFARAKLAAHGGYVYYVSDDLKRRWGEGEADADTAFVQPPGTPTVGLAFLRAFEATGDRFYLEAAREAAGALIYGQLESGGWTQTIHWGSAKRIGKYRNGKGGNWNVSSLDDDQTQAALRFLMEFDRVTKFGDKEVHEAALSGLTALRKAQFPNGAFPQVWTGPSERRPIVKARFPDYDWKTEGRIKAYWDQYTLNDGLAGSVADTLIAAHEIYRDDKDREALKKLGDFLILAQMPEPQPGWCQQYNADMEPIWARKFEPPAVSGWESQDVMKTLIRIAQVTGDKKYLEPIPAALAYFKKNLLPDGQVARFYELKTNKPLYMDAAYRLTYDDSAVPGHYGWKQSAHFKLIEARYEHVKGDNPTTPAVAISETNVRKIIADLDEQGRWVSMYDGERLVGQPKFEKGFRFISSEVLANNIEALSRYVQFAK